MPAPLHPERHTSAAPRCDSPVQGDGIMSYHCTLAQGHGPQTSDPEDPQPCYAVESARSVRIWQNWSTRDAERMMAAPTPLAGMSMTIDCPKCTEPAMKVTADGGLCENCGATAEIQPDPSSFTEIGEPMLPGDGTVAMREPVDPARDADIRAAAQAMAPTRLEDNCLGEHDPAINLGCQTRPAPPEGTVLVDPGPQSLTPEQVPTWVRVVEGSHQPTAPQVAHMKDLRDDFLAASPGVDYAAVFEHDSISFQPIAAEDEDFVLADGRSVPKIEGLNHEHFGTPTKQRDGDQILPKAGVECVQDIVIDAMVESKAVGTERYGQPLMTFNGRKGLQDIVEEARDFFVYGTMLLREFEADREVLTEAVTNALKAYDDGTRVLVEADPREISQIAVDTIMGWVVGERAEVTPADTAGVSKVAAARRAQIAKGYDAEHDASHGPEVLVQAARSLLDSDPTMWPWGKDHYPGNGNALANAGALIAAAIDTIEETS